MSWVIREGWWGFTEDDRPSLVGARWHDLISEEDPTFVSEDPGGRICNYMASDVHGCKAGPGEECGCHDFLAVKALYEWRVFYEYGGRTERVDYERWVAIGVGDRQVAA